MKNEFVPLLFIATLFMTACGGENGSVTLQATAPIIASQPKNLIVAVGQPATFSVSASGTTPIHFQWYWNGSPIVGATDASFTPTLATIPADNGSIFTVTASNTIGSDSSTAATLNVSQAPRAPIVGDVRFKDVDAFPFKLTGYAGVSFYPGMQVIAHNMLGTPIRLGGNTPAVPDGDPNRCNWEILTEYLPSGVPDRDFGFRAGFLTNFESDLIFLLSPDTVVTSLDIENGQGAYAATWVSTHQTSKYSCTKQLVQLNELQDAATQAGGKGQVITAITFNTGGVYFLSYRWDMDPSTIYEVSVSNATTNTFGDAAISLAKEGYIITAVGGNDINGFLLVGTRVQGDTMSRPIQVGSSGGATRGYSLVGSVYNSVNNNTIWVYEQ